MTHGHNTFINTLSFRIPIFGHKKAGTPMWAYLLINEANITWTVCDSTRSLIGMPQFHVNNRRVSIFGHD
ncbi:hypothetical protein [Paenibacillus odorifer]|uniref:hypothetical protein n=1 Tax=Paenibacillus odorifer TaxID=189426 RepID=UPI0015C3AE16|nr:hypothetical protein [Paenibacillus odorifer]